MTEHEASPDLTDFMRLIAQQATTSQAAQQYDSNRTERFLTYLANWITNSKRLPATAQVAKTTPNTFVMTVTVDTPADTTAIPLPAPPHTD